MDAERDKQLAGLLVEAQRGDQVAYERFLTEAASVLRKYLVRRVGSDVAEDVLQDTLLALHRVRRTYSPGRPVGPWMYAVCSNRIADFFRKKRRIQRLESDVVFDERSSVRDDRAAPIIGPALDALRRLPEKQRRVIELLKVRGLTVKEVAVETGMSESSVKTTAFRGYETIRKLFGLKR